jgi:phage FluMu gp28-like protein
MKQWQKKKIQELSSQVEALVEARKQGISTDPVEFFTKTLHLKPYDYQAEFLRDPSPLRVLRWPRRAGKTTVMSGDDIHFAALHPGSKILALMPKAGQTKEIYFQGEGGLHDHLARMDRKVYSALIEEQLQTIVRLRNRSVILAETPEPFTIRGHGPRKMSLDEFNFFRKDKDLWLSALLPMTLTRIVRITIASTPWNKDSLYWRMCFDKAFKNFSGNIFERNPPRYLRTWKDVLKPNGPLDPAQVDAMREQYAGDSWRWRREMESEFVDDETSFLPSSLIIKCQNSDLGFAKFEDLVEGSLNIGWDLGRERDPAAVAVVNKVGEVLSLVHWNIFPLGTPYVSQMAYIKSLCDRWKNVEAVYYDHTGTLGMDEEINKAEFPGLKGVDFSQPNKHGMARFLKQKMMSVRTSDKKVGADDARRQFEYPFDINHVVEAQLNCEQWEQRPGTEIYAFSHPQGTHDDLFWAIALACLASTGASPESEVWVVPR